MKIKTLVALAAGVFFPLQESCAADVFAQGMLLGNDYSYSVSNTKIRADLFHESHRIRWSDGWDLTLIRKRPFEDNASIDGGVDGGVGIRSDFKYLTMNADISSVPWFSAGMTLHTPDSLIYAGSRIARGKPNIGTVLWKSNQDNENIPDISASWESDVLLKGFSLGSRIGKQEVSVNINYAQSTPRNRDDEYYIRDSISIWETDVRFRYGNAEFSYTFVDADATIYGIRHQDDSRKRFLYAPLESRIHLIEYVQHDILNSGNSAGRHKTGKNSAGTLDIRIFAGHGELGLSNDGERFHETLAPNRALRSSLIQVLSFSFLQQNYRIDADFEATAEAVGFAYSKPFGSAQGFVVEPNISADFYYAIGSADIRQISETTNFVGVKSITENFAWNANSFGTLLDLGIGFGTNRVKLNVDARQVLPFTFEVDGGSENEDGHRGSNESSDGLSSASLLDNLGNGLLFTATLSVRF